VPRRGFCCAPLEWSEGILRPFHGNRHPSSFPARTPGAYQERSGLIQLFFFGLSLFCLVRAFMRFRRARILRREGKDAAVVRIGAFMLLGGAAFFALFALAVMTQL
jgi:hypothetical protein